MARPSKAQAAVDDRDVPEPSPVAARTARRALASRESAYIDEVQRLLDAGLDLMVELGDERAPRVAEIVERADLSNQAFYRHFASKDELIAAVVEAGARPPRDLPTPPARQGRRTGAQGAGLDRRRGLPGAAPGGGPPDEGGHAQPRAAARRGAPDGERAGD